MCWLPLTHTHVLTHCSQCINTLRPRQDGCHFTDDSFKWMFLNKNVWISINISLKFVPRGPINNIPTEVQVMACRQPGNKPISEPMMVRLPTHISITRPQWVKHWSLVIVWQKLGRTGRLPLFDISIWFELVIWHRQRGTTFRSFTIFVTHRLRTDAS